ncbi:hypothetical protein B7494_g856 [Chlorociboria aeruginascens]|nr:hypothetical protein B7494_g856 [Chlorociboria aeruginascens]
MSLKHPFPNVYKFFNQFAAPDQASPEQSSRSQGLRKSGPRSKTGCSTCKQRRVKCDEGKPGCVRCQNLGRDCGGYAPEIPDDTSKHTSPVPIHPRPMSVMPYAPTVVIVGDEQERRYFQRFCDKTAGEISGAFDPTFWTEKVLQLCHHDAPIRYATIALGALAKSLEITSFPTRLSLSGFPQIDHHHLDEHHRYALRQYSRAITALRTLISDGRRHLRTSLTSCVLFITFEALQGNYEGALTHLQGGSRLLADWRIARFGQGYRLSQDSLSQIQDALVDDLGRMFARLDVQGIFVPPPYAVPDLMDENLTMPLSFSSVQEARETWDFLLAAIGQFYRQSVAHSQSNPEELEIHPGLSNTHTTPPSLHTEMLYDEYTALFAEIVSKSQLILSTSDNHNNTARFTLDMGTILPLVITAVKCRDRKIRRQAIALLWSKARREGLSFDTILVARICSWLLSIESEGIPDFEPIPESSRWMITYLHLNSNERWMAVQLTCV